MARAIKVSIGVCFIIAILALQVGGIALIGLDGIGFLSLGGFIVSAVLLCIKPELLCGFIRQLKMIFLSLFVGQIGWVLICSVSYVGHSKAVLITFLSWIVLQIKPDLLDKAPFVHTATNFKPWAWKAYPQPEESQQSRNFSTTCPFWLVSTVCFETSFVVLKLR